MVHISPLNKQCGGNCYIKRVIIELVLNFLEIRLSLSQH